MSSKDVKEFDSHAVVPQLGYRDVDHYWTDASAVHLSHEITIPTLALSAMDDPMCSAKGCPREQSLLGEGLVVAVTRRGGHLGFSEGLWPPGESWMDRVALDWFDSCRLMKDVSK